MGWLFLFLFVLFCSSPPLPGKPRAPTASHAVCRPIFDHRGRREEQYLPDERCVALIPKQLRRVQMLARRRQTSPRAGLVRQQYEIRPD